MKKITILALHLGYGGIEKAVSTLVNSLCDKYIVNIICIYKLQDKPAFEIDERVNINYLIESDLPVTVAKYKEFVFKGKFGNLFKELFADYFSKGKILSFIKDSFAGIFMYPRRFLVTKHAIKKADADVIISTRSFLNKWLGKYGDKNIKKIGWEHNHPHGNAKYAKEVTESAINLDYLVLVSNQIKDIYDEMLNKKKCKCVCIPNSLDYIPDKPSSLKKKRMISVGRLSLEKGYDDLIKVFNKFCILDSDWTLDIVGDGTEREKIENLIKNYGLNDKINMHGFCDKKYINNLLKDASIYLMCSHTESFGIVLIESMSFGIPCIAFNSAEGASEIISNGENGYLISDRNIDDMADKMKFLVDNYEIRKNMGKKARETALIYTNEQVSTKWINLFESEVK